VEVVSKAPLGELAEDWCRAKAVSDRSTSGNTAKARRTDLARWGRTLRLVRGRPVDEDARLDLELDLEGLTPADLSVETMVRALEVIRGSYKPSSTQRLLSNMRGFCRWLSTAGYMDSSPFDSELLDVRVTSELTVRAFSVDDVAAMLEAAGQPDPKLRSAWSARDVALVDLLASTGVRSSECVALQVGDLAGADRPVLLIRRATKSGKRREVPIPRRTMANMDAYLGERRELGVRCGPRTPLLVTKEGAALTNDALYYRVKRIARSSGAVLPDDAMVHGLRHHFGLQLALRGVPPATLQQLMGHSDPRTTAVYTRHASFDLINALDDAGWL